MAVLYPDSSALVKRYLAETGTAWMKAMLDPTTKNEVYVARITYAEIIAAISRRQRAGSITPADAVTAKTDFRADFAGEYLPIEVTDHLIGQAALLAEKHFLRGYDAVQLAAALEVSLVYATPILVLCADAELTAAARLEGLAVDDPNLHP
jgi:predicted nucleic acid-binding protein